MSSLSRLPSSRQRRWFPPLLPVSAHTTVGNPVNLLRFLGCLCRCLFVPVCSPITACACDAPPNRLTCRLRGKSGVHFASTPPDDEAPITTDKPTVSLVFLCVFFVHPCAQVECQVQCCCFAASCSLHFGLSKFVQDAVNVSPLHISKAGGRGKFRGIL